MRKTALKSILKQLVRHMKIESQKCIASLKLNNKKLKIQQDTAIIEETEPEGSGQCH